MKFLVNKIVICWRSLALTVRMFSLRSLVLLSALCLFLAPGSVVIWTALDEALVGPAIRLANFEKGSVEFAVITVPDEDLQHWQSDLYSAETLSSLLSNVLHASQAVIGIVFPQRPHAYFSDVEKALLDDARPVKKKGNEKEYVRLAQKKQYRQSLLNDKRVVLGYLHAENAVFDLARWRMPDDMQADTQNNDFLDEAVHASLRWFQACFYCTQKAPYSAGSANPKTGLTSTDSHKLPANIPKRTPFYLGEALTENEKLNFFFRFLTSSLSTEKLNQSSGVKTSHVIAANNMRSFFKARVVDIDFSEALVVNAFPEFVLVGAESQREKLHEIANVLQSFHQDNLFFEPWWQEFALRIAFAFLALYLCFIHVRFKSRGKRWFFSIFIFITILMAVLVLTWTRQYWVSVSSVLIWYVLALTLLSWWRIQNRYEKQAERALNEAVSDAAVSLESHECVEEAMTIAMHQPDQAAVVSRLCHLSDKLASDLGQHDLGIQLLRRAQEVNRAKKSHYRGFSRIEKQIQKLKSGSTQTLGTTVPHNLHSGIPTPEQLGRYKIQREIGRGSVGVVYQAFDPAISRKVAVKTLDTRHLSEEQAGNLKARFFREAEAAGRLSHPNIVSVFDVGEAHELAYIAMDFVDGRALNKFVDTTALLPTSLVYRIVHDVAMALDYAHNNQIVHRDIKPGNIMYCESPYLVKVADFGIARLLDNSRTTTGEILGSPLYMSPEQLKGARVGPTADIFSLGVTFYQLLTGKLPFNAENLAGLTYEIIHTKHPSVRSLKRDLPASATRIINQCLQKKPTERYDSAAELASVLKKALKRDFPSDSVGFGIH